MAGSGATDNIWQAHLCGLIEEWRDETGDSPQPVPAIEEYLYESLADLHRSRFLGNGVFLSTVHSVKGMEFDHVFVLGGSWREKDGPELEEERRLMYVAITRARETLQLLELDSRSNPHARHLSGQAVLRRRIGVDGQKVFPARHYHILGMKELYLGYAGNFHDGHNIHAALRECRVGDRLNPVVRDGHIYLENSEQTPLARLSRAARDVWLSRAGLVQKVRVLAMVRWGKADMSDITYVRQCRCEVWEIPVCELSSR